MVLGPRACGSAGGTSVRPVVRPSVHADARTRRDGARGPDHGRRRVSRVRTATRVAGVGVAGAAAAAGVVGAGAAGLAAYFTRRVLTPDHVRPDDVVVHDVDLAADPPTVTLGRT